MAVAFRILGSVSEAEDAVQEAWLHLSRADAGDVRNLPGWLTTVTARVCLDMLRSRRTRREAPLEPHQSEVASHPESVDPEEHALLADSVGAALLVVLDTLAPAERVAFVLHDTFAVPFEEIAQILGRTPAAARKLASRARRRVRGTSTVPPADLARQRELVGAFLAASQGGDFRALMAVLDPDVVVRADAATPAGARVARGAREVARQALAFSGRSRYAHLALVRGAVGIVVVSRGRLSLAMSFTSSEERIVAIELIADPARLRRLDLAVLDCPR